MKIAECMPQTRSGCGETGQLVKVAKAASVSSQASFSLTPDLMLPNTMTGDNWLHSKFVSSMLFDNPLSFP